MSFKAPSASRLPANGKIFRRFGPLEYLSQFSLYMMPPPELAPPPPPPPSLTSLKFGCTKDKHKSRDQGHESYSATHARRFPGLTLSYSLRRSRVAFTADSMLDSTVSPSFSFGSCSKYPTCRSDRERPTIASPQVTRVGKDWIPTSMRPILAIGVQVSVPKASRDIWAPNVG